LLSRAAAAARDIWKKRYYDEKKLTPAKEESCNKQRAELEQQNRRITGQLETARDTGRRTAGDRKLYDMAQLKILSTRLEQDIEGMHSKLEYAKIRLTTEIKVGHFNHSNIHLSAADFGRLFTCFGIGH